MKVLIYSNSGPVCGGRTQKVVLADSNLMPWLVACEVLQGLVWPPMLFKVYMQPLGRLSGVWDDTQLNLSFLCNSEDAASVLRWCLVSVTGWIMANRNRIRK